MHCYLEPNKYWPPHHDFMRQSERQRDKRQRTGEYQMYLETSSTYEYDPKQLQLMYT